jgi:hypothetical protein
LLGEIEIREDPVEEQNPLKTASSSVLIEYVGNQSIMEICM